MAHTVYYEAEAMAIRHKLFFKDHQHRLTRFDEVSYVHRCKDNQGRENYSHRNANVLQLEHLRANDSNPTMVISSFYKAHEDYCKIYKIYNKIVYLRNIYHTYSLTIGIRYYNMQ